MPAARGFPEHESVTVVFRGERDGGAEGIRTPDPHNAIVVLYQLSYDPISSRTSEH